MTRQNKGDVRKMKNCKDLISRYISVIGAGAVSVLILNVIFLLFQNVIQVKRDWKCIFILLQHTGSEHRT